MTWDEWGRFKEVNYFGKFASEGFLWETLVSATDVVIRSPSRLVRYYVQPHVYMGRLDLTPRWIEV